MLKKHVTTLALIGILAGGFLVTGCDDEYSAAPDVKTEHDHITDEVTSVTVSGSVTNNDTGMKVTASSKVTVQNGQATGATNTASVSDTFNATGSLSITPSVSANLDSGVTTVSLGINYNTTWNSHPINFGVSVSGNSNGVASGRINVGGSFRF